jgi:tellurite resistance protein TerC
LALLAIDLYVVRIKKAWLLSGGWIGVALCFNLFIYFSFGPPVALQFFTGYLIEKALSIDNLCLFLLIFSHFKIPAAQQHSILFWGILGVLFFRILLILTGITLITLSPWVIYGLGLLLLLSGVKLVFGKSRFTPGRLLLWLKAHLPTSTSYQGPRFFIKERGHWKLTLPCLVLIIIECTDVVLAIDSVPAIFAVTTDPFIVYTSNILAILGLRSLYSVLASSLHRLRYLKQGLSLILAFVGVKMLLSDLFPISILTSLAVIGTILAMTILFSLSIPKRDSEL